MDDREAHLARLRELSAAQKSRALTPEELREVAGHFRAIGDKQRATAAERAAAAAEPTPAAAAPVGEPSPADGVDPREAVTRVHTLSFASREVELEGEQAASLLQRARGLGGSLEKTRRYFGTLVVQEWLPPLPLPLPRQCTLCGAAEIKARLTEQARLDLNASVTLYTLLALNAQYLDLDGPCQVTVPVGWPLCGSCRDGVEASLPALRQVRKQLLAARRAAGPLGGLLGGKRGKAEQAAVEALRQVGLGTPAIGIHDLPRVTAWTCDLRYSEVADSGHARQRVELAVGSDRLIHDVEDAAASSDWTPSQIPGSRSVSVFEATLELAGRLDDYQFAGAVR